MISRCAFRIAFAAALCSALLAAAPVSILADDILEAPRGVRSWGMGMIGTADPGDPGNVYFNPALAALTDGFAASGSYWSYPYSSDWHMYHAGLAYGREYSMGALSWRFGGSYTYSKLDFGEARTFYMPEGTSRLLSEQQHSLNAGGGFLAAGKYFCGVGFSAKPWSHDYYAAHDDHGTWKKTAFDIGFIFDAGLVDCDAYRISASAGAGFLNLGDEFSPGQHLPEKHRFGAGIRLESAISGYMREHFEANVPVFSAAADLEFIDNLRPTYSGYSPKTTQWGFGSEMSLLRILFLRAGVLQFESSKRTVSTFGVGLGFSDKKFWARADYALAARYPSGNEDRFGVSFGIIP